MSNKAGRRNDTGVKAGKQTYACRLRASMKKSKEKCKNMSEKLSVIDGASLLALDIEPPRFIVAKFIPAGLHILAGSPKIGKSIIQASIIQKKMMIFITKIWIIGVWLTNQSA